VAQATGTASVAGERVELDRVVAVVNGDLILESDLDEEARMAAFQPFGDRTVATREQLTDRLIDRDLILQQIRLQPQVAIADTQVDAELGELRKSIPECASYNCATDAGWKMFVAAQGFTLSELHERWRQRMEVLRFVEARFRMGIRISQAEIDTYYKTTLIPAYRAEKVTAPAEDTIADRIQEILLQQQVDKLLDDWLTSLRAEGSVKIVKPGEELP
jgi:parvulin-like peptidyl-prolyl isomerase